MSITVSGDIGLGAGHGAFKPVDGNADGFEVHVGALERTPSAALRPWR